MNTATVQPFRRALVVVLASLAVLTLSAIPSGAHQGEGTLTSVWFDSVKPLSYKFEVRLVYTADGHDATGATVTVVADGPSGRTTPIVMEPGTTEGRYAAEVVFPQAGEWTVRFTAADPPATLELDVAVTHDASGPAGAGGSTTTTNTPLESTSPPGTAESTDEGSGSPLFAALSAVGIIAVVWIGGFVFIRSRRST